MPLSEEELRLLEQMERALVEEDPKFASTLRGTSLRRSARRRAILAGVVFLVGVTILMTGAITPDAAHRHRRLRGDARLRDRRAHRDPRPAGASAPADPRGAMHPSRGFTVIDGGRTSRPRRQRRSSAGHGSFMERMEERWRRRRESGGF